MDYDQTTGQYTGKRPEKPDSLKGKDESGQSLTAHHIYPWNKIRDDLNAALKAKSQEQMQKILDFAGITVSPGFWTELAKDPGDRAGSFGSEVSSIAEKACWAKPNVFMGPLGEVRTDDPGEKLDTSFMLSGLPTPASAVGELTAKSGGIGKQSPLARLLARNVREASGGQAEPYKQEKWAGKSGTIGKGKKKRKVTLKERRGRVPNPYASP